MYSLHFAGLLLTTCMYAPDAHQDPQLKSSDLCTDRAKLLESAKIKTMCTRAGPKNPLTHAEVEVCRSNGIPASCCRSCRSPIW